MNKWLKKIFIYIKKLSSNKTYTPSYKVINLFQNKEDNYVAHIQVINKSVAFYAEPEEILANDKLVNMFSPVDIRALTYLGYLGINMPKYKILAQRMVKNGKSLFAIKQNGDAHIILKTANEILQNLDMVSHMPAEDARVVGYTAAIESSQNEKQNIQKQ